MIESGLNRTSCSRVSPNPPDLDKRRRRWLDTLTCGARDKSHKGIIFLILPGGRYLHGVFDRGKLETTYSEVPNSRSKRPGIAIHLVYLVYLVFVSLAGNLD